MIYGRTEITALKLNSSTYLKKLSRGEMLGRLQLIHPLNDIVESAWKEVEERKWKEQLDDSPHGHPWHVSFHASQFPGDDPRACPRQSLYRMMDLPSSEPFSRRSRTVMDAGKAIEITLVQMFHDAGQLLSAPPDAEVQTGFEVADAWLTGSVDCVILPPRWNKPLPIEVKSKYQKDIDQMKMGRGPDTSHVFQLKTQLALVALQQRLLWPGLDQVTHGFIYYLSRDRPFETAEFRVDLDMRFYEAGIARLKQWRQWFIDDVLPEENPGRRSSKFGHPMGWKWSYLPCAWCTHKKTCQLDFREDVHRLSESAGVNRARLIRPNYDFENAKKRVLNRWKDVPDGSRAPVSA